MVAYKQLYSSQSIKLEAVINVLDHYGKLVMDWMHIIPQRFETSKRRLHMMDNVTFDIMDPEPIAIIINLDHTCSVLYTGNVRNGI